MELPITQQSEKYTRTFGAIENLQMATVTGLTSEVTAINIGIADHIVKTVSTGGTDASVSIDDTTYLYSNVSTSPVISSDGSLKLSYENLQWTLTALASMTDEYGNSYNQNDVIGTWKYDSNYSVSLYL